MKKSIEKNKKPAETQQTNDQKPSFREANSLERQKPGIPPKAWETQKTNKKKQNHQI